jgi:hypothetical protein
MMCTVLSLVAVAGMYVLGYLTDTKHFWYIVAAYFCGVLATLSWAIPRITL